MYKGDLYFSYNMIGPVFFASLEEKKDKSFERKEMEGAMKRIDDFGLGDFWGILFNS
jgi:hypothetical protein